MLELSTIFVCLGGLLRALRLDGTLAHRLVSYTFAALFLALRVIYMPWIVHDSATNPRFRKRWLSVGPARHLIHVLLVLQVRPRA